MTSPVRALWDAPPASPAPPRRVWRDWVLVGVLPLLVAVEAVTRTGLPWRWLWAAMLIVLVPTLLWRRTHPLAMLAIAFACGTVLGVVTGEPQLFSMAYFLVLVYALMRWGSGRAMIFGGAILLAGVAQSFVSSPPTPADAIGGLAVLVATATLGITFRWRASARAREVERVRLLERERLARDLHDTVAHHVSAIAIQAQAGTVVAAADPAAAAAVLQVIEGEASRTLDEMRSMVRVLRQDESGADRTPAPGIRDVSLLADPAAEPPIDVHVAGDAGGVPPAIGAAAFRIAQESVTNARRHAHGASRIDVRVDIEPAAVRIEVRDDGERAGAAATGYGITGMAERAALLGGTLAAGPRPQGGWAVSAVLPLDEPSS